MSLDGLRAWIGEVERKLAARTRVFLVLVAIAIGAAGAGIYLALEADDGGEGGAASAEEVRALREQVSTLGAGTETAGLEAQIIELRTQIEDLKIEAEAGGAQGGADDGAGTPSLPENKIPESEAK